MSASRLAEPSRDCGLCPRLVDYRTANRAAYPDWFNAPAPSFGDPAGRLLIVGLAPGLRGANRTGRPFTGDYAGDLLYATLDKFSFSKGVYKVDPNDGLQLVDCLITNAVRCVPPENKPTGAEAKTCRQVLIELLARSENLKAIVCLGKVSHDNVVSALGWRRAATVFGHGAEHPGDGPNGPVRLFDSYHCSRYNTNTGRLTEAMFEDVFAAVRRYIDTV